MIGPLFFSVEELRAGAFRKAVQHTNGPILKLSCITQHHSNRQRVYSACIEFSLLIAGRRRWHMISTAHFPQSPFAFTMRTALPGTCTTCFPSSIQLSTSLQVTLSTASVVTSSASTSSLPGSYHMDNSLLASSRLMVRV